ncbi:MAG TPA: helix-turn-helix domain-containing protein [Nocardioides sp.]
MRAEGTASYVGGRTSVPLPSAAPRIAPRPAYVTCSCKHRGLPGAFHVCIDLTTPAPAIPKPKPRPKPKPKPASKTTGVIGRPRALSDEQAQEAADLYTSGATLDVVAERFGVSRKAVQNILDRLEVPRRRPGPYVRSRGAA